MNAKNVKTHIVNWLLDYTKQAGIKGFVIGISGGIDSAVTSALGAETGLPLLCVEMPIYQDNKQVERAKKHINVLEKKYPNVSRVEVELTHIYDSFLAALPVVKEDEKWQLSLINSRARLRMTTLYYFAALHTYLVLGTGNKVEDFGVGFFTKYGDGGVDLSPIADLVKSEVYELGSELGIITEIMKAPPTDGLWGDDRTDEDQIGASYPELEWAMDILANGIIDFNTFTERQKEVLAIYTRMNRANQHKMNPIPTCVIPKEIK